MTDIERLAAERLKGLQSKEREVKELKRELEREKAFNDAMVDANRSGRQSLIKFKQRVTLVLEQVAELQSENAELKDTIDCQDEDLAVLRKELQEAREAAARADKAAETLHANTQEFADLANERLMKIRKLEQQVQTQGNMIAKQADMIERMNVRLRELS